MCACVLACVFSTSQTHTNTRLLAAAAAVVEFVRHAAVRQNDSFSRMGKSALAVIFFYWRTVFYKWSTVAEGGGLSLCVSVCETLPLTVHIPDKIPRFIIPGSPHNRLRMKKKYKATCPISTARHDGPGDLRFHTITRAEIEHRMRGLAVRTHSRGGESPFFPF